MWAAPVGIGGKNASNSVGACWGPSGVFTEMPGDMVYDIEPIGVKVNLYSLVYKLMVCAKD